MKQALKQAKQQVAAGRCGRIALPGIGRVWRSETGRVIVEEYAK